MLRILFTPVLRFFNRKHRVWHFCYRQLDAAFRAFDNRILLIVEHLHLIPPARYRTGGQGSLAEYGYSAGALAAQIGEHLTVRNPRVLDLGCGTGKMVSAIWPFLGESGRYTGLDISQKAIAFDRRWYPPDRCRFIHAPLYNQHYNPTGIPTQDYAIPLDDASIDLAVAFSLFTHLDQADATHYFRELARLIAPGGLAVLTFFLLDERYDRARHTGTRWDFDRTIEGQPDWWWASWFKMPARQIAVTPRGVALLHGDDFTLEKVYRGWWTGAPGAFLQDTLVFRRG